MKIVLELNIDQVNLILKGLQELPWKEVNETLILIKEQGDKQVKKLEENQN